MLVLTGAAGYFFQDLALSLKIKGPLADDAIFVLSDGKERHEMDFIPTTSSAGENVWWIVHKLNEEHARDASQGNYVAEQTGRPEEAKSFWYASSRGATLKGMLQESENYNNSGSSEPIAIKWNSIDVNSSNLRIVYKNVGENEGNVTLTSNNWTNVEYKNREVKPNEFLTFKKSWTAFIPGIIGLLLIALAQAGEKLPNARKHIMHLAVLLGFVCLLVVGKMIGGAVGEMFWLKEEPYGIIHASMLKSVSMLLSTGLLAIFVVLCVVSFIEARKEKAEQKKLDTEKEKKKASEKIQDSSEDKDKESSENDPNSKDDKKVSDTEENEGSDQDQVDKKPSDKISNEEKDDSKEDSHSAKKDERLEKKTEKNEEDSKESEAEEIKSENSNDKDSQGTPDVKGKDSKEKGEEDESEIDESSKNSSS